jgi:hypothetical protein
MAAFFSIEKLGGAPGSEASERKRVAPVARHDMIHLSEILIVKPPKHISFI